MHQHPLLRAVRAWIKSSRWRPSNRRILAKST
jgi:hypothetical protein